MLDELTYMSWIITTGRETWHESVSPRFDFVNGRLIFGPFSLYCLSRRNGWPDATDGVGSTTKKKVVILV